MTADESRQGEVTVEWRVVRNDGHSVPIFGGSFPDEHHARLTLKDREQRGQMGPYRLQTRTVTVGEWGDLDDA